MLLNVEEEERRPVRLRLLVLIVVALGQCFCGNCLRLFCAFVASHAYGEYFRRGINIIDCDSLRLICCRLKLRRFFY